eukprot:Platyproteum_vivax@DN3603_c0_g1_i1.p1
MAKIVEKKLGKYSKAEDEKLKIRLNEVFDDMNMTWEEGVEFLYSKKAKDRRLSQNNKQTSGAFWTRVGTALPLRSVFGVRSRVLILCCAEAFNKGTWSSDERLELKQLVETYGRKWVFIGKQMNRFSADCLKMYAQMYATAELEKSSLEGFEKQNKKQNTGSGFHRWTAYWRYRLLLVVQELSGEARPVSNIPWDQVARELAIPMPATSIRFHYLLCLLPSLLFYGSDPEIRKLGWGKRWERIWSEKKVTKAAERQLIRSLHEASAKAEDTSEVDFGLLLSDHCGDLFSTVWATNRWKVLSHSIYKHSPKDVSFSEVTEKLYNKHQCDAFENDSEILAKLYKTHLRTNKRLLKDMEHKPLKHKHSLLNRVKQQRYDRIDYRTVPIESVSVDRVRFSFEKEVQKREKTLSEMNAEVGSKNISEKSGIDGENINHV